MVSIISGVLVFCCLIVASSGGTVKLWTKDKDGRLVNIPYVLGNFNATQKEAINQGMNEIMAATCIRFVPRKAEEDYVFYRFSGANLGSSSIGKIGGEQFVYVTDYGAMHKETAIHESLHTLGLHHTHQRYDRDKFVNILTDNINPDALHAFDINTDRTDIQGTPYDFDSIMQYYADAFSKNGKVTILPKDLKWIGKFGNAKKLSDGDILRINRMYNCPGYKSIDSSE